MSLLDKAKAQIQVSNEKRAEKRGLQGKRLVAIPAEYTGGYKEYKKAQGILTFYENITEFKAPLATTFILNNKDIVDTSVEGRHDVNRRITVTRLVAIGIFAFALKKKNDSKEAFITLELINGQEVILYIKKTSPLELKRKLNTILSQITQGDKIVSQPTSPVSIADELTKLAELKKQGLLTSEEYNQQKQRLLE